MAQGGARVHGIDTANCVIWMEGGRLAVVHGRPAAESIRIALEDCPGIGTFLADEAFGGDWPAVLPAWRHSAGLRLTLPSEPYLPLHTGRQAVFLDVDRHGAMISLLENSYREELQEAFAEGPVAISMEGGAIAAYCFAGWKASGYADLCVLTLPAFRGRGHASTCCATLISHLRESGVAAQWVTLSSNRPSLRLARRLGFKRLQSLLLFKRESYFNQQ
jgi:RimJ/RimL family protein N-acetyltransferase